MAQAGPKQTISDAAGMIAGMSPVLYDQRYCFCTLTEDLPEAMPLVLASFREEEGLSLILSLDDAERFGLATDTVMRRITLNVYSALEGVGLTAAVATALAQNGIACNMVAAFHHDHAFVPDALAEQALTVLRQLAGQDGV